MTVEGNMIEDDIPATPYQKDEEGSFSGQLGIVFGALLALILLFTLVGLMTLGGVDVVEWLRQHL
jgi:hypothetical protein